MRPPTPPRDAGRKRRRRPRPAPSSSSAPPRSTRAAREARRARRPATTTAAARCRRRRSPMRPPTPPRLEPPREGVVKPKAEPAGKERARTSSSAPLEERVSRGAAPTRLAERVARRRVTPFTLSARILIKRGYAMISLTARTCGQGEASGERQPRGTSQAKRTRRSSGSRVVREHQARLERVRQRDLAAEARDGDAADPAREGEAGRVSGGGAGAGPGSGAGVVGGRAHPLVSGVESKVTSMDEAQAASRAPRGPAPCTWRPPASSPSA